MISSSSRLNHPYDSAEGIDYRLAARGLIVKANMVPIRQRALAAGLLCVLLAACSSAASDTSATGCTKNTECSSDARCDVQSGACEPNSTGNAGMTGMAGAAGNSSAPTHSDNVSADTQCKPNPQSGCPTGSVCLVANAAGDTSCYSAGTVSYAGACSTINDCQVGLLCVYGQCRTLCSTSSDCLAKYAKCAPYPASDDAAAIPGSSFCSLQCNPADPTNIARDPQLASCLADSGCYPMGSDGPSGATSCYSAGTALRGASCEKTADCRGGLVCLTSTAAATTGKCTPYCVKGQTPCASGSCQSFAQVKYVGIKGSLVELGYCG